jgi:hypothetical protein
MERETTHGAEDRTTKVVGNSLALITQQRAAIRERREAAASLPPGRRAVELRVCEIDERDLDEQERIIRRHKES